MGGWSWETKVIIKERAYEFFYLIALFEEISKIRTAKIEENSSPFAAERAWNTLTDSEKTIIKLVP